MSEKKKTMLDYIQSIPECLRENIENSVALTQPIVDEYVNGGYKNIWIIACGSSHNGSYCARSFMKHHLKCDVRVVTPFAFTADENDFSDDDMLVCVSQSGYSTNILEATKLIKSRNRRVVGITGDVNSDLKDSCDVICNWGVGRETVGFVTRGVTSLAMFFMLFALEAAKKKGMETEESYASTMAQLRKASDVNQTVVDTYPAFFQKHYKSLTTMFNAYVCSVGANMGTCYEGALKFGETISIPTAAYEAEEFIHGPNLQMTPRYTTFLIDGGCGSTRLRTIYQGTRIVSDNTYMITNQNIYGDDPNVYYVEADVAEDITPIIFLPVFQYTSFQVTEDLNRWLKHPLECKMEKIVTSKSANYINSPFSIDTPRREGEYEH